MGREPELMANEARELERRLSPVHLDLLHRTAEAADELGVEVLLVGGTVRDILSGNTPADLDLVAVGGTSELATALAERLDGEVLARSQFRTAKLRAHGVVIDLAAARSESYSRPGALPTVEPGTIEQDLARRDFSINAMAISLGQGTWGEVIDPFNGRRDLQHGLLRVLHSKSFVDDATRILRAVRYASRMGLRFEEETERLLRRDLGYLDAIGGDRLRHETERLLSEPRAADTLEAAQDMGVLHAVHPALKVGSEALARLREPDLEPSAEPSLRLLALLVFGVPAVELPGLLRRLSIAGRWARVAADVGRAKEAFGRLCAPQVRPSQVVGLLRGLDVASIEGCALAADEPMVRQRLELYVSEPRHVRPLLDGHDLIALGVPEGPRVGELLEGILAARLDGLLSTREDEETYVVRSIETGQP